MALTRDAMEAAYATRSGLTVQRLRELGRLVVPCPCESDLCEGWQCISRENAESEIELGRITRADLDAALTPRSDTLL